MQLLEENSEKDLGVIANTKYAKLDESLKK
jgi:hypothetical protein